jgi:hypothetical protein
VPEECTIDQLDLSESNGSLWSSLQPASSHNTCI